MELSRRSFLTATALGAIGVMLGACAPKATETPAEQAPAEAAAQPAEPAAPASKEKVLLKYHIFWNQPQACEEAFRATAEWQAIEAQGYEIEFGTGRGGDAGRTAVAAGTPPDVGDLGPQFDFILGGKMMDMGPYIEASEVVKPELFFEGNWTNAHAQWQGVQYGVPAHECYVRRGLNMNSRMIGEAGLDINNPPQTLPELFDWHVKLTKFDAAGNMMQFGIDPYDAVGNAICDTDGWFLKEVYAIDNAFEPETGTFHLNDDKFVQAVDFMGEFYRQMGPDNLQGMRSVEGQGTWGGSYNAEVQAMIFEGYWHPGETVKEKPEVAQYNVTTWIPMPDFRKGDKIQEFNGHAVGLFAEGAHAKEAFPIVEFLQSKAACDIIFNTLGWLPALKDYVASVDGSKFPGLQFYLDSATTCTHAYGDNIIPIRSFIQTKGIQYEEQVYRDTMTAKEAMDAWQKDVETEWEESGWKDRWGTE
ncbi:MAG: substrate-binding domain-containing protein [Anaerolineales bacterium]